jgi:anti-sigma-K factor RskA
MNCEELKEMYELYALGLAELEERDEIAAHLARGCDACRRGVDRALALNTMLLATVEDSKPPARLKRRIMASIGAKRRNWTWAGVLAAACMLAIAVWLGAQERERARELADARRQLLEITADRDSMASALRMLEQPDTLRVGFGKGQPAPPHGNVFVNGRDGVLLIAANLPPLSQGRMFEMWLIPKGGAPRPAGMFQPTASGLGFNLMSGPVDVSALGAIAVTIEPEAGSPAPTSTPIFAVPVAGP